MIIFDREYFSKYLDPAYKKVFSGFPIDQGCFVEDSWCMALLPGGLAFDRQDFDALSQAATLCGDCEFYVTQLDNVPPHEESALLRWSRVELEYVRWVTDLQYFDAAVFSLSSKWGAYVEESGGCTCVGGDSEFMDAFFAARGGQAAVRARFEQYAKEEWEPIQTVRDAIMHRVWGE